MAEKSKIQLADDLESFGVGRAVRRSLVKGLRDGFYDEFNDDSLFPDPLIQLTVDLRSHGLEEFAKRVVSGNYDAGLEDSSHWAERQTGEVSDIIDALGMRDKTT